MKLLVLLTLFLPTASHSQKAEKKAIRSVIDQLFEGMKKGDSSLVSSTFFPEATLSTTFVTAKGEVKLHRESLTTFLDAVGTPHQAVWDERIRSCEIRIDGNLATVWTKYTFYIDQEYAHEGVNAFQLVKTNGSWKILVITDTRRKK